MGEVQVRVTSELGCGQWYVRTLLVSCNEMGTNRQGLSVLPGGSARVLLSRFQGFGTESLMGDGGGVPCVGRQPWQQTAQ